MDSDDLGLDSRMKTLLIYALNPEAGAIKQHFQQLSVKYSIRGMELLNAGENFDLLRTGIGLERAEVAVNNVPEPHIYDQVIHFGVSGSLDDELPVRSFIRGQRFTALNKGIIELSSSSFQDIEAITFFSSMNVVSDEASRRVASAGGARAVDMESYAIAEFCQENDLPLIALRIISDRAGASTPEEFRENFKTASHELQTFIIQHVL